MFPPDLQAFLLLLLFIAPGYLFTRAYWREVPRYYREPDLFHQIVSTVIASTVIHIPLLFLFGGGTWVYMRVSGESFTIGDLFKPLSSYPVGKFVLYSVVSATYFGLSLRLGWYSGSRWQEWFPVNPPLWARLMAELEAGGIKRPWCKVRLRNGEEYTGILEGFRWVGSREVVYEIVLTNVSSEQIGASTSERRLPHHRVLLLSVDILWIGCRDVPRRRTAAHRSSPSASEFGGVPQQLR